MKKAVFRGVIDLEKGGRGQRDFQSVTTKRLFKRGDLSKYVSANIPISCLSYLLHHHQRWPFSCWWIMKCCAITVSAKGVPHQVCIPSLPSLWLFTPLLFLMTRMIASMMIIISGVSAWVSGVSCFCNNFFALEHLPLFRHFPEIHPFWNIQASLPAPNKGNDQVLKIYTWLDDVGKPG